MQAAVSIADGIKGWLQFCTHEHDGCRRRELGGLFSDQEAILLIDVARLRVVRGKTDYRYVALSYVWGDIKPFETTKSVLDALIAGDNSLKLAWLQIPCLIQDAIRLTADIGETYLWVDSICIVQDDPMSKHHQLELMAEIYNRATATFVACSGNNAGHALASDTYSRTPFLWTPSSLPHECPPESVHAGSEPLSIDVSKIYDRVMSSYHNQRGWTYQERLLSRRRIYFLEDTVIFHCRQDTIIPIDIPSSLPFPPGHSVTIEYHPIKLRQIERIESSQRGWDLVKEHLKLDKSRKEGPEWPIMTPTSWLEGFTFWSSLVSEYSRKHFAYEKDVLRACTGVLHAFKGYSTWHIAHGMPVSLIDLALHWTPKEDISPRDKSDCPFPTWSWLAWKGEVDFPLVLNGSAFRDIKPCLDFVKSELGELISAHRRQVAIVEGNIQVNPPADKAKQKKRTQSPPLNGQVTSEPARLLLDTFGISATVFRITPSHDIQPNSLTFPRNWLWLTINGHPATKVCAVLYSPPPDLAPSQVFSDDLEIILLSESRQSPYTLVNRVLAPEIALNLLEDLGESSNIWSDLFNERFKINLGFHDYGSPPESAINSYNVPFGTIRNIMMVRKVRSSEGSRHHRVAIGQIVGRTWDKLNPQMVKITLC